MKNPFFSIFIKSHNTFEGQLPDERTVKVIRMHWYTLAGTLVVSLASFILIVASIFMARSFVDDRAVSIIRAFSGLALLFWWYWTFYHITMYVLRVWIITNQRVVSSRQYGLFNRRIVELAIENIQDISVNIDGMFGTFLEFGDIEIQTAGAENKFFFRRIPEPLQVKELLMLSNNKKV
jgi:uncharacterized membrane protein YdbT with pleckstrin-like domain